MVENNHEWKNIQKVVLNVNSIYLDSINFDNYNENLAGLSKRSKARIRWYSREKCQSISSDTEFTTNESGNVLKSTSKE